MTNGSSLSHDEFLERKRRGNHSYSFQSPPKKAKLGSAFNLLFTPFTAFVGMFRSGGNSDVSENREEGRSYQRVFDTSHEHQEDNDDVIFTVNVPQKSPEKKTIVYLNSDIETRAPAGCDRIKQDSEEAVDKDVIFDRVVEHHPEILDDDKKCEEEKIVETTIELQDDGESQECTNKEEIIILSEVRKNKDDALNYARKVQNEIVYLNEDEADNLSTVSSSLNGDKFDISSPTPDESVSRCETPNIWASNTSNSMRDHWRRSSKKANSIRKTSTRNSDSTFVRRVPLNTIRKPTNRKAESSYTKYIEELCKVGILTSKSNSTLRSKNEKSNVDDLIAKAKKIIKDRNSSRGGSPSMGSRDSSVFSELRECAGAQSPSSSRSDHSVTENKLFTIMSKLKLNSMADPSLSRYESVYNSATHRQNVLNEEIRIRNLSRQQRKEESIENVRKKLSLIGVFLKSTEKDEFIKLPSEAQKLVETAWNSKLPASEVLIEEQGTKLTRKDLLTLSGLNWLNDEVINFYLGMISSRSSKDSKYLKAYSFNTFFYTNITSKGYASVKRWTRKVDIFSYDVILVPVHLSIHWCMAVINIKDKRVDYYDSLLGKNIACLDALRSYLKEESLDKKKVPFDFNGWSFNMLTDIPKQNNGSDCGVFSCQFAEFASRNKKPIFSQSHMPYYRKRMVYEMCTKQLISSI